MKKSVPYLLVLGALVITFWAGKSVGAATPQGDPGSVDDPLVTKSYVQVLENKIAALEQKVSSGNSTLVTSRVLQKVPLVSRAFQSSYQTLRANTWTKITFQKYSNSLGNYLANSRYTVPENGYYLIDGNVGVNTASDGNKIIVSIFKNGSELARLYEANNGNKGSVQAGGLTLQYLPKGSYIELYTNVSAQKNTLASWNKTFILVYKVN